MKQVTKVPVDFSNRGEDGAIRLVTQGTVNYLKSHDVELTEGLSILMSDGEMTAEGSCTRREGMWVAVVRRWIE